MEQRRKKGTSVGKRKGKPPLCFLPQSLKQRWGGTQGWSHCKHCLRLPPVPGADPLTHKESGGLQMP